MKNFFKKYHELLTIPAVILLFILSIPVLRWFDPTAAVFDAGVFQIMILSMIQLVIYLSVAWFMLKIAFGHHRRYLQTGMKNDFDNLEKWQKLKLTYSIFFLLVALLAYMAKTVS
ncbi:MAG: hypothetical protein WCG93_10160 [Paludibacter sp.]